MYRDEHTISLLKHKITVYLYNNHESGCDGKLPNNGQILKPQTAHKRVRNPKLCFSWPWQDYSI